MRAILYVILKALDIYWWIIILSAVFSWLYAFNVINARNPFVESLGRALYTVTEPVFRPIRNILPNLGAVDLSPIVVLLGIMLIQEVILRYIWPYVV